MNAIMKQTLDHTDRSRLEALAKEAAEIGCPSVERSIQELQRSEGEIVLPNLLQLLLRNCAIDLYGHPRQLVDIINDVRAVLLQTSELTD